MFNVSRWVRPVLITAKDIKRIHVTHIDCSEIQFPPMKEMRRIAPGYGRPYELRYGLIGPGVWNWPRVPPGEENNFLDALEFESAKSLRDYVEANREMFTLIEGTEDPPAGWDSVEEEESSNEVDLEVQIDTGKYSVDCDALIGEVEEALEATDLCEFEMIDGVDGEVIVRLPKSDAARATSVIRKILRKAFTPEQIQAGVEFFLNEEGKEPQELPILPAPRKKSNP
jgi:hypothetical protein